MTRLTPKNLTVIPPSKPADRQITETCEQLKTLCQNGAHFTNGTYAIPLKIALPTTVVGFRHVHSLAPSKPFVIAINSDASMSALGKTKFENELTRAHTIAAPLARRFPDTAVIVVFYHEQTPTALYQALSDGGIAQKSSLQKWGYGTMPDAPKIEGAEYFKCVYGFPLPNNQKPVCYHDTAKQDPKNPQSIEIVDLRDQFGINVLNNRMGVELDQSTVAYTATLLGLFNKNNTPPDTVEVTTGLGKEMEKMRSPR